MYLYRGFVNVWMKHTGSVTGTTFLESGIVTSYAVTCNIWLTSISNATNIYFDIFMSKKCKKYLIYTLDCPANIGVSCILKE
jgi:hypothetical protein